MPQLSSTENLLEQLDALLEEEDADGLFFTPSKDSASSSSSTPHLPENSIAPVATPRRKTSQSQTATPLSTGAAEPSSSAGPSSRSLVQRTRTSPASPSTARRSYPTKWTKGHDQALIIFAASLSLLHRQYLQKLPFFEPWSGYGWSHLSNHLRKAMRNSLRDQGCSFELPSLSKGSSGGGSLPDEVVQAMEDAIMRGANGAASTGISSPLSVTPRRRPTISNASRSPLANKSSTRRRLNAGAAEALGSEEDDTADLDSTASSAGLQTPPPRARRPIRSSAGKRSAALSTLKGFTSSNDEEEDSLCLGAAAKKRRRNRSPSTDSALDELWEPQTPTVDRPLRSTPRSAQTLVKTPSRPSARPLVQTPSRPSARPLVQTPPRPSARPLVQTPASSVAQDAARERLDASQQLVRAEAMCIDLTLSEDD